jgi:preprotein translocase subunit SecD
MKVTRVMIVATAAAVGLGLALAHAEDIALSLVSPAGRIDISASAIKRVEALEKKTFRNTETGELHEIEDERVEICYSEDVRQRICQLTQRIVGQPLRLVVACKTVSEPIVREPLCKSTCLEISSFDLAAAKVLAQRIRSGMKAACPPTS